MTPVIRSSILVDGQKSMPIKSTIYKKRIAWWLNPWVIALVCIFLLAALPMVLWIASYNSLGAVLMFVITYLSLLVVVLFMVKKSMLEPHLSVDEKEIEIKRKEIQIHREQERKKFIRTELEVLQRGERTPVLDVWRLDPVFVKRHPYFQALETVILDPKSRELHMRIQIGELLENEMHSELFLKKLISTLASFIRIMRTEKSLQLLKKYFHLLIIEFYSLRIDENHRTIPFPVFSMLMNETELVHFSYIPSAEDNNLKPFGDVRFDGGSEITPHRGIESMTAGSM